MKLITYRPKLCAERLKTMTEVLGPINVLSSNSNSVLHLSAKWSKILLSFSVRRNGAKILHVENERGSVEIFHGVRVLSMIWIIMGHSCSFAFSWLTFSKCMVCREIVTSAVSYLNYFLLLAENPKQLDQTGTNILSQTLENGTFSVDTFFYLR